MLSLLRTNYYFKTFYKKIEDPSHSTSGSGSSSDCNNDEEDAGEEREASRGDAHRNYLKNLLISHPIWKDGNYWEQVLWQCAIAQVKYIV
jgi:hypothetical protein